MPKKAKSLTLVTASVDNSLREWENHSQSLFDVCGAQQQSSVARTIGWRFLGPYFRTQAKINNLSVNFARNLWQFTSQKLDHGQKLIDALVETQHLQDQTIEFFEKTHLLSHTAQLNALTEKQNYLFQKVLGTKTEWLPGSNTQEIFFSQFGEDQWIVQNLKLPKHGFFIDVGTADGITFSNTYYFEKQGWQGICFEPSPTQFQQAQLFRQDVRPQAIADQDGEMELYLSASSPNWASLLPSDDDTAHIRVPVKSLATVVKEEKIKNIDVLSIDVEGAETLVLQGFPFAKLSPRIMIV